MKFVNKSKVNNFYTIIIRYQDHVAFLIAAGHSARCGEIKQILFWSFEANMLRWSSCTLDGFRIQKTKQTSELKTTMKLIQNHHFQKLYLNKSSQISMVQYAKSSQHPRF